MAITNRDRVDRALELLRQGLAPFVESEVGTMDPADRRALIARVGSDDRLITNRPFAQWDVAALLKLMWEGWRDLFSLSLGHAERAIVSELREYRHRWAHQQPFSYDDTYRVMDSVERLLTAVSAPQAAEVQKLKMELLRLRFDEQVRGEKRKNAGGAIETVALHHLKPWREVITPHRDVATGNYQQAEFAADLWQVHLGEAVPEYQDPREFFRRTYLTESLKQLLVGAVRRLTTGDGDPVVQLQTNFGGGKTHSMLALYHLFSGVSANELTGVDSLLAEAGVSSLPRANRVVLVGNKISPGNPMRKPDGTIVRTLWGELAYQLGGPGAYARVAADDERATSPGDTLRELFNEYGPCVILVDEWVAYARQLHDRNDLPGGSFETQFSFAQALSESAKLAKNCLLVISLPASDVVSSAHGRADDLEVGGQRGREALDRLRNVIGRVESSWRPASAEESFEIVRRRLFEPLSDPDQFKDRDVVARAFADLYRAQPQEFPPECRTMDYENRIKAAYPIHPEVFDRLYTDWSTLVKFQRTRGVLRLMAAVIHSLWEKGDRNPLILPANIPIDDPRVQLELTRNLPENWVPVIEKDVDGANSLPLRIDGEINNLGKYAACRRVARTIFLGSAPTVAAANRGLEDRRIKLGCVMPGESPSVFGDALRRLATSGTYLYQDGARYWYSTQPTVTKLAEDRAEQIARDRDKVAQEIESRVRADVRQRGDFSRVHPMPRSGQDVPDDLEAKLVVLGIEQPYSKGTESPALIATRAILESRGPGPRLYANTLVFLAPDQTRLQDLEEATCRFLAWKSIVDEKEALNLDPQQVRQAEIQLRAADGAVSARLPEAYQWLLVPEQTSPQAPITWQVIRLTGHDPLAVRASKKLRSEELLLTGFAGSRLRMELDRIPLWRGDHVTVRQLVEDFARYIYLPRLRDPAVLTAAVQDGASLLTWESDGFAFADSYDEATGRYRGLRAGQLVQVHPDSPGLLVKPDTARRQMEADRAEQEARVTGITVTVGPRPKPGGKEDRDNPPRSREQVAEKPDVGPRRFYGSVSLDPTRVGRDASRIAEEVISHLVGLVGANVKVTLEIEATVSDGVPEQVVRTVTENCRTLKFSTQGFEKE